MIWAFALTILMAAIFAGLSYPVYEWTLGQVRGRKALGAIATLLLLLVLVMAHRSPRSGPAQRRAEGL